MLFVCQKLMKFAVFKTKAEMKRLELFYIIEPGCSMSVKNSLKSDYPPSEIALTKNAGF